MASNCRASSAGLLSSALVASVISSAWHAMVAVSAVVRVATLGTAARANIVKTGQNATHATTNFATSAWTGMIATLGTCRRFAGILGNNFEVLLAEVFHSLNLQNASARALLERRGK